MPVAVLSASEDAAPKASGAPNIEVAGEARIAFCILGPSCTEGGNPSGCWCSSNGCKLVALQSHVGHVRNDAMTAAPDEEPCMRSTRELRHLASQHVLLCQSARLHNDGSSGLDQESCSIKHSSSG